ncbi:MAG: hypothetical protein Q7T60_14885 [Sphingopyxis sp.]|nr:hypothetical protein [Sphingopyxis sp.]
MKIPPRRRKTAYSSLRRIAMRIGVHFTVRRLNREEEKPVPPVDPAA